MPVLHIRSDPYANPERRVASARDSVLDALRRRERYDAALAEHARRRRELAGRLERAEALVRGATPESDMAAVAAALAEQSILPRFVEAESAKVREFGDARDNASVEASRVITELSAAIDEQGRHTGAVPAALTEGLAELRRLLAHGGEGVS